MSDPSSGYVYFILTVQIDAQPAEVEGFRYSSYSPAPLQEKLLELSHHLKY